MASSLKPPAPQDPLTVTAFNAYRPPLAHIPSDLHLSVCPKSTIVPPLTPVSTSPLIIRKKVQRPVDADRVEDLEHQLEVVLNPVTSEKATMNLLIPPAVRRDDKILLANDTVGHLIPSDASVNNDSRDQPPVSLLPDKISSSLGHLTSDLPTLNNTQSTRLNHTFICPQSNNTSNESPRLLTVPLRRQTSNSDSSRSTFELSNIDLPSGFTTLYAEPMSFLSSPAPSISSHSPISPKSQPNLRASFLNSELTKYSTPFDRSATTPVDLEYPSKSSKHKQQANKRRSTIIGGEISAAVDYRQLINAIKQEDKREQARAMSTIVNPLAHSSCQKRTTDQSRSSRRVREQYLSDIRDGEKLTGRTSNSQSHQQPTQLSHVPFDQAKTISELSSAVSSSHPHTSHSIRSPGSYIGTQEQGPLVTESWLRNHHHSNVPITTTGTQSASYLNSPSSGTLSPKSRKLPSALSTLSSPSHAACIKTKRSLPVGKLSKLLTKLRKDDSTSQTSPHLLDIPPVPAIPSSLSVTTSLSPSSTCDPSASPLSISSDPNLPPPIKTPGKNQVVKKKQSFTQRIARRLSLSANRPAETDHIFDTSEALPLPTSDTLSHHIQLQTLSSVPLSKTPHHQNPSRPSESSNESIPGFELVDDIQTNVTQSDPHIGRPIGQTSQVYLGLLTPSTSDKDLTNVSTGTKSSLYPTASPSPVPSYCSTDPARLLKGYLPPCLPPSPALSDFHSPIPGSPIDPTFVPTPSPTQRLTRKSLAPLHIGNPASFVKSKVSPSSASPAAIQTDSEVVFLSTGFGGLSPIHLSPNASTDWLGPHNTAPLSSCTDYSTRRLESEFESSREDPSPSWCGSSESEMSQSVITHTSFGASSHISKVHHASSSLGAQHCSGYPGGSRAAGLSSNGKVGLHASRSTNQPVSSSIRTSARHSTKQRGNDSESDRSNHVNTTSAIGLIDDTEGDEEGDSDDSDDVPLGQRHPDALKVQKSLREDRAKRHARRKAREAAKAEMEAKASAAQQRHKQIEEEQRNETAQRELDLAATVAKLSMRTTVDDEDDNKPLCLLKRGKSTSRSGPLHREPFAVSPEDLSRRLEKVQSQDQAKDSQRRPPRMKDLSINTNVASGISEPIGHPLLPQTDASVRSRKQSQAQLEPLSPFIKESVLTMGSSNDLAIDDDYIPLKSPVIHSFPARSRQESAREENSQGRASRPSKTNEIDTPSASGPVATANSRRQGLKRGQTIGVPASKPAKVDHLPSSSVAEVRPVGSRSEGLRRGNTTSARQPGTAISASPPLPTNSFLPTVPVSGANLSRAKSQARHPTSYTIPSHPNPHDSSALHSPIAVCPSPIINTSSLPRTSRRALQKVAITDQSRTVMIEIEEKTTVSDLLKEAEQRGELKRSSPGEWGVFEVWENLGIERPIREVEKIFSVVDTWTANTDNSYLLIQKHPLSSLAIQKRAMTAGSWGSNLFCELKPGKWSKKYVVLRENAIYICSNEKGKDEMFLCTLTNFDVFYVASSCVKAPRPFAFGVKSLDKFSFFETKSDFVHYFACKDESTQLEWIRRIYDARTFYIMSNATSVSAMQESNRTKLSDPPSAVSSQAPTEHSPSSRPKVVTNPVRIAPSPQTTTEPLPTEGRSRNPSANGALTRKPTLVGVEQLSKFRQGTLLGDLNHNTSGNSRPTQQPALPPHITPAAIVPNRGWEQMGPNERKEHIAEVQARAKSDGKTLLRFEDKLPFGQGGMKKLGPDTDHKPLSRSRTLGSRKIS